MDPTIFDHSQYLKNPWPSVSTVWKLESLQEFTKLFELLDFPHTNRNSTSKLLRNVDLILVKTQTFITSSDEIKLKSRFIVVLINEEDWSKLPQEGTTVFLSRKIGQPKFKCHFHQCIKKVYFYTNNFIFSKFSE